MTPQQLVRRFYDEVLNGKHPEALDDILTDDFVEHGTPPIELGIAGFRDFLAGLAGAFPDITLHVDDWIVEGDRVVARVTVRGTHLGEAFGFPATGRPVRWTAIHIWRVRGGRLAERWSEADVRGILSQLEGAK